jgi:uncharacterized membrane protein
MIVSSFCVLVGVLAMFDGRSCVLLGLFMLTNVVMMGRLMVMMRRCMVVSGRIMVMLTRGMLCLCHFTILQTSRPAFLLCNSTCALMDINTKKLI